MRELRLPVQHGLSIGETTCSCIDWKSVLGEDEYESQYVGGAILSIDELSRIAMERSQTAREAIQVMGALAVEFGFFGPGSFEGVGETLMIADKTEAWVFHILPDPTESSAVWIAQQVPPDSFAVCAK